ncbi:putative reverse transcriptase zinc-binding domain-containing protein [Helianthus anomalus]
MRWNWKSGPKTFLEISELNWINRDLDSVKIEDRGDRWTWIGTEEYSVGAVRRTLKRGMNNSNNYVLKWSKWIPVKCNVHAWRAEMDKIPTAMALRSRNIEFEDTMCPLCGSDDETSNHLFTLACRVWLFVARWCKVAPFAVNTVRELLDIHDHIGLHGLAKEIFHGIVLICCWSLWRVRNGVKLSNSQARIEEICSEIKSVSFLWFSSRSKDRTLSWSKWCNFVIM